jgi:hypothetical protein
MPCISKSPAPMRWWRWRFGALCGVAYGLFGSLTWRRVGSPFGKGERKRGVICTTSGRLTFGGTNSCRLSRFP